MCNYARFLQCKAGIHCWRINLRIKFFTIPIYILISAFSGILRFVLSPSTILLKLFSATKMPCHSYCMMLGVGRHFFLLSLSFPSTFFFQNFTPASCSITEKRLLSISTPLILDVVGPLLPSHPEIILLEESLAHSLSGQDYGLSAPIHYAFSITLFLYHGQYCLFSHFVAFFIKGMSCKSNQLS